MEVYTIGYSAFSIEKFISVLQSKNIKCLIDARSTPYSQYFQDYNKEQLEKKLKINQILYRNYSKEFGARQNDMNFYDKDGILDFGKFILSGQFQSGVEKVKNGIKIGYSFAIMCAEKDPIDCHRAIMVGRGFKEAGFSVKHIVSEDKEETQEEIESRLLDMYYKDRGQLTLFSDEAKSDEEMIADCYLKRNKEIGYHIDDDYNEED